MAKIGVVIVTYNNSAMLKSLLDDILNQTVKVNEVVVIDNASTDSTGEMIKECSLKYKFINYVRLIENIGSAGGYHEGLKLASIDNDFIWTFDDDISIKIDAVESLLKWFNVFEKTEKVGVVKSWVGNSPPWDKPWQIYSFAWRGTFIKKEVITQIGLPNKEFFIYADDVEYSFRIVKNGYKMFCVPDSRIIEKRKENKLAVKILWNNILVYKDSFRIYYAFRNEIYLYLRSKRFKEFFSAFYYAIEVILAFIFYREIRGVANIKAFMDGIRDGLFAKLGKNPKYLPNKFRSNHRTSNLWSIVLIELSSHCNFSCSFCPSDSMTRKKTMMKRELWEKIISELTEKNLADRIFLHLLGEPLVYKDIFEVISFANLRGLPVSLYTNGALLNEDMSHKLLDVLKNGHIVLSMQEIEPKSFEKRSRGKLLWLEYLEHLKNFIEIVESRKESVPIQVHCMIDMKGMGWNLPKIFQQQKRMQLVYDQWRMALGLGRGKRINVFNPTIFYPIGERSSFFVKHLENWSNYLIDEEFEIVPQKKGRCPLMTDTFAILSDGTCTFCCSDYEGMLNLGNAYNDSLESIYYGDRSAKIREAEKQGLFIEKHCQICQGVLVDKKNKKPVYSRIKPSDYYIFKNHLKRYGLKSSMQKIMERLNK